jgi:hypothetical protein
MDLFVDTSADPTALTTFDSITLLQGSTAEDISTGDKYRMQTNGTWVKQPGAGAFTNVYTKAEIDAIIANYYTKTEADDIFDWITVTIQTDTLPLTFISDGSSLTAWIMKGNGSQSGTPTPDNPVIPEFVGTIDDTDWTIPITCAGQTVPVYLGQVSTVRKIMKLVLDGTESWNVGSANYYCRLPSNGRPYSNALCTHAKNATSIDNSGGYLYLQKSTFVFETLADFKSYLAQQYAKGTPVTVWYVIANEQTGIINEPLAKIGDYADELHSTDAAVTITTAKGSNTLTVDTTLQPSEMAITGKIRSE